MTRQLLIVLLLLSGLMEAQEPVCFVNDGTEAKSISCSQVPHKDQWRVLESPQPKRHWINRHPKLFIGLSIAGGALIGGGIAWEHSHYCHAYEYGNNGVDETHCPKETK